MNDRSLSCSIHGRQKPTFVCHHLVSGERLGFVTPDDGSDHDEQTAWCSSCEAVRAAEGGWNDFSESYAQVTMICTGCFEAARQRNAG